MFICLSDFEMITFLKNIYLSVLVSVRVRLCHSGFEMVTFLKKKMPLNIVFMLYKQKLQANLTPTFPNSFFQKPSTTAEKNGLNEKPQVEI